MLAELCGDGGGDAFLFKRCAPDAAEQARSLYQRIQIDVHRRGGFLGFVGDDYFLAGSYNSFAVHLAGLCGNKALAFDDD